MGKSKVDPNLIHLLHVRVIKAYLNVSESYMENSVPISGYRFGAKSNSGFNVEEKLLRFRIFVRLIGQDKDQNIVGVDGDYIIEFLYKIDNLDDFVVEPKNEDERLSFIPDIGATIAGISYSTSRGIILDRTQGTDFNGVLLPVINPNELLNEDTYSELE